MNEKLNYYLKQLKIADKKSNQIFTYLQSLETEKYDELLQRNINRICVLDEIISQIIICLELDLEKEKK